MKTSRRLIAHIAQTVRVKPTDPYIPLRNIISNFLIQILPWIKIAYTCRMWEDIVKCDKKIKNISPSFYESPICYQFQSKENAVEATAMNWYFGKSFLVLSRLHLNSGIELSRLSMFIDKWWYLLNFKLICRVSPETHLEFSTLAKVASYLVNSTLLGLVCLASAFQSTLIDQFVQKGSLSIEAALKVKL